MGIFSRIGTLFKSNINDIISKAEDPERMLNQVVLDMQTQLVEAKKQVAVSIADQKAPGEAERRAGRSGAGVGAQGHARGARRR